MQTESVHVLKVTWPEGTTMQEKGAFHDKIGKLLADEKLARGEYFGFDWDSQWRPA